MLIESISLAFTGRMYSRLAKETGFDGSKAADDEAGFEPALARRSGNLIMGIRFETAEAARCIARRRKKIVRNSHKRMCPSRTVPNLWGCIHKNAKTKCRTDTVDTEDSDTEDLGTEDLGMEDFTEGSITDLL